MDAPRLPHLPRDSTNVAAHGTKESLLASLPGLGPMQLRDFDAQKLGVHYF